MLAIWNCNNFHCPNREKFKRYISHVTINTNLDQIIKITSESEVLSIYLVFSPQYCMAIKCSLFISLPVDNFHWCCGVVFVWGFFYTKHNQNNYLQPFLSCNRTLCLNPYPRLQASYSDETTFSKTLSSIKWKQVLFNWKN